MTQVRGYLARAFRGFVRHHGTEMAASIAYQVLFTMIPLTSVMLAGFGFVMRDPEKQQSAVDTLLSVLPLQSDAFITASIRGIARQRVALTTVGLLGLVWSATGLFGTIRTALNITWEVRNPRTFVLGKLVDIAAILGLGILFAASVTGTLAIHMAQSAPMDMAHYLGFEGSLRTLLTLLALALPAMLSFSSALMLYRFVPNVRHGMSDVWWGAVTATALFEITKHVFVFYVSRFRPYQTLYGAIGDLMLFMLWTWVSASILLIGAELAAAAERTDHGPAVEAKPAGDASSIPGELQRSPARASGR